MKYHITYYEQEKDSICTGINITAQNEREALDIFYMNFPNAKFLNMLNVTNTRL